MSVLITSFEVLFAFLDLSLYELHRTPQEAITDDTEITISPRSLHSELMCPICLDMLKNTMTTKEASVSHDNPNIQKSLIQASLLFYFTSQIQTSL